MTDTNKATTAPVVEKKKSFFSNTFRSGLLTGIPIGAVAAITGVVIGLKFVAKIKA